MTKPWHFNAKNVIFNWFECHVINKSNIRAPVFIEFIKHIGRKR